MKYFFFSFLLSALLISRVCCETHLPAHFRPSKHFGHVDECNALLQFKNSLTINKHISNSACVKHDLYNKSSLGTASWKESSDCCTSWDGIECDNVTGNVISVDLTCSYLEGILRSNITLFSLRHLAKLSLGGNHLTGSIPSSICLVSSLRKLGLASNALKGTIPQCLGNLSKIEILYLDDNMLGGSLPRSLANCTSLYGLDVENNKINDTFPFWLAPSLVSLELGSNHFHGLITLGDAPFPFPSLHIFNIDDNHFHGHLPPDYFRFSNISSFFLSSNMFDGFLPNPPTNSIFYAVANNRFAGEIPSSFCNITSLFILEMSHNSLSGEIPQCLITTKLEMLVLLNNSFRGPLPEIKAPTNCILNFVALGTNHLKGKLPLSWALCKNLVALDLSGNELGGSFPVWLGALQNLSILILRSNKFYGQITPDQSAAVHPFPMLQIFDISNNNFNGTLKCISNFNSMMSGKIRGILTFRTYNLFVTEWARLIYKGVEMNVGEIQKALLIIDVSYNHFQDEIPNFIGNLQLLKGLNLSHNNLRGVIPSSLGNLTNLEWLDLSSNNFTGEIPSALTSLTQLAVFNVSMNHLTGEVPRGKQFDTFLNDSYRGNPGLCGPPLSKSCAGEHPLGTPSEPRNEDDGTVRWMSGWITVLMGYGIGTVIGISIGYLFVEIRRPPMWLIEMVERWRTRN